MYSDNWIEQGGRVFSGGNVMDKIVQLHVEMKDVNYSINLNTTDIANGWNSGANNNVGGAEIGFGGLTTKSFKFGVNNGYYSDQMMNWVVRGYKA